MMLIPDHALGRLIDAFANVNAARHLPGLPGYRAEKSLFNDFKRSFEGPRGLVDEFQTIWNEPLPQRLATLGRAAISFPYFRALTGAPSGPKDTIGPAGALDESWFFINGVCSDLTIATANQKAMSDLVRRPIKLLYNATDGVLADLAECAFGKTFGSVTEAAALNMAPLVEALCDPLVKRVVLVSHSQGTIVAAVLLKVLQEQLFPRSVPLVGSPKRSGERTAARTLLRKADENGEQSPRLGLFADAKKLEASLLAGSRKALSNFDAAIRKLEETLKTEDQKKAAIGKLEMYCFANCATSMAPFVQLEQPTRRAPWIESYGNENDLVARLGMLAREHGVGAARIEGDCYFRAHAWGHLLNAHYLSAMYEAMKPNPTKDACWTAYPRNLRSNPRLWDYVGGKTPAGPI